MEILKKRPSKISAIFFLWLLAGLSLTEGHTYTFIDSLDKTMVKNLSDDWLVFDAERNAYIPYLDTSRRATSVSRKVELGKYKDYHLNFRADRGLSLFINNKLYYTNTSGSKEYVKFPISEIPEGEFAAEDLITFYNPERELPLNKCYIGQSTSSINFSGTREAAAWGGVLKSKIQGDNFFMLLFLGIVFLFALGRSKYPKLFAEFYDFSTLLPSSSVDDNFILEIYNPASILFILINACSWCLLLGIAAGNRHTLFDFPYASTGGILVIAGLTISVYLVKYIYLKLLGSLFNLHQIIRIQFFELVKISLKLNLICVPVAIVLFYARAQILDFAYKYFLYTLVACGLIVLVRISFLIFKYSGFRNIYLFSYLCTTEILPLIIIIKVILF